MRTEPKVIFFDQTGEPTRIVAAAARLSTTQGTVSEIYDGTVGKNNDSLIRKVLGIGHKSVAEHATFNIGFEGVSVFFEQFLIEFRLAAYTVKSRRYVDYSNMEWYVPRFRKHSDTEMYATFTEDEQQDLQDNYNEHVKSLFAAYAQLLELGIPKEDARFVLPYCFHSHTYCTMNARELVHLAWQCVHGRGRKYPECVMIGNQIVDALHTLFPSVVADFGPDMEPNVNECRIRKDMTHPIYQDPTTHIPVSKSGEVQLLTCSNNIDATVLRTALIPYNVKPALDRTFLESFEDVFETVLHSSRPRELEQVSFTFEVNNITLAGLTHLARHRMQNLIVPDFGNHGKSRVTVIPETVRANDEAHELFCNTVMSGNKKYFAFIKAGVAQDDLVYLYLAGDMINVIATMNGRELYHFCRLRDCYRAQWEIQGLSNQMNDIARAHGPRTFRYLGPGCLKSGKCPEGKMSCGRMREVAQRFEC